MTLYPVTNKSKVWQNLRKQLIQENEQQQHANMKHAVQFQRQVSTVILQLSYYKQDMYTVLLVHEWD